MVKIAIAGASGNVGQEILDVLVATKKHEILLLTRKDISMGETRHGVTWAKTDYQDVEQLKQTLLGVHTVLSFITTQSDPGNSAQKTLIDAAVQAGVKRFAPSEWASSDYKHMPWNSGKVDVREYLRALNRDEKVLEYCLFQPGMFTNYLTSPYKSSNHIHPLQSPIDFNSCRALMVDGGDKARMTLTTVQDTANVVARAIEYEGEWPLVGGIRGEELTVGQIIALGEKIRGKPFKVEKLKPEDLKGGVLKSSWIPKADHPAIPPEQVDAISASLVSGLILGVAAESMAVSNEWNLLLPDYKFTTAEEFLSEFWQGR